MIHPANKDLYLINIYPKIILKILKNYVIKVQDKNIALKILKLIQKEDYLIRKLIDLKIF